MSHQWTTFRQIPHPTLADLKHIFRKLDDCCSPSALPYANAASSKHSRGRGHFRYTRHPWNLPLQTKSARFARLTIMALDIAAAKTVPALDQRSTSPTRDLYCGYSSLAKLFTKYTPANQGSFVNDPSCYGALIGHDYDRMHGPVDA
jgi:hypothetical protein